MKDTTIKQAFGELWHTIRLRNNYYNELYRNQKELKENLEMILAFKVVYNELDDLIDWLLERFEKED